jgi:hypothetical protein
VGGVVSSWFDRKKRSIEMTKKIADIVNLVIGTFMKRL